MALENYSTTRDILRFEGVDRRAYWKRFAMLLSLSVVIATMGLVRNSGAVVIAAMLIAPLMTPILGIAASMVIGRNQRVVKLFAIVIVAALLCVGLAWLIVFIADVPRGIIVPEQILARTDPGTEDLIVALAAGGAGAYVQINRSEVSLLPGAAIGVSLVPPLSAAGVLVYFSDFTDAYEAVLLFTTNLAAIILAACAVYILSGARSVLLKGGKRRVRFTLSLAATLVGLTLIVMQLVSSTISRYAETRTEAELALVIEEWSGSVSVEIVRVDVNERRRTADIWVIIDLPLEAGGEAAPVLELIPDRLKGGSGLQIIRDTLGPDYAVAFRYQPRFAGLVFLDTEFMTDAPGVERTADQ